jgi:hypothetical protein
MTRVRTVAAGLLLGDRWSRNGSGRSRARVGATDNVAHIVADSGAAGHAIQVTKFASLPLINRWTTFRLRFTAFLEIFGSV